MPPTMPRRRHDQPAQVAFALDALESHFTTTLTRS
jgi:hypothetical protein